MNFLNKYFEDLKDVATGKVFTMDYNSGAVPLSVKMEKAGKILTFLVSADTIWVTPLSIETAAGKAVFGETKLFNGLDETDPMRALFNTESFKEQFSGYKYYITAFWPKIVDTTAYALFKDNIDVLSGKEGREYYEAFRDLYAQNPTVILEESKIPTKQEDNTYGYVMLPLFKKAIILGEKTEYIEKLNKPILESGGVLIGVWNYTFNLFKLAAKADVFRNVEYGCVFFYAEGNLLTINWKLTDPNQVYARGKFIGKEQNTNTISKHIKEFLSDWIRRLGVQGSKTKIAPSKFGIFFQGLELRHHALLQEGILLATGNKGIKIGPLPISSANHSQYTVEVSRETQLIKAIIL
jgi:hypothetical protein